MADNVQRELEAMIPELEDLTDRGLFSSEEIRSIVSKRRDHEYNLQRRAPRKEDFLRYIEYEISLERLRKKRKKRKGIKKSGLGDSGGKKRIHFIYERSLRRFKGDIELWNSAIDYSLKVRAETVTSKRLGEAVKLHPRHVPFWIKAAKFHFEVNSDVKTARSLLQSALRVNNDVVELWKEYLRLEALFLFQLRKRREVLGVDDEEKEENELLYSSKFLEIVFDNARKAIPGSFEVCKELAAVLVPFMDGVIGDIAKSFVSDLWKNATTSSDIKDKAHCWEERVKFHLEKEDGKIETAIKLYKEALEAVPSPDMVEIYASFLTNMIENNEEETRAKRRKTGKSQKATPLKELAALLELDILLTDKTLELIVSGDPTLLDACIEYSPGSVRLCRLQLKLGSKSIVESKAILVETLKHCKDDGKTRDDVEGLYRDYLSMCSNDSKISLKDVVTESENAMEWFYEFGAVDDQWGDRVASVANGLLKWISLTGNRALLQKVFENMLKRGIPPVLPVSVFETVINLKLDQGIDNKSEEIQQVREIFQKATQEYRKNNDLWVAFLRFEREHGTLSSEKAAMLGALESSPNREALLEKLG
mmetsp:Transcript_11174/g.20771  ORF Transcript_11174/g.20771 Transcript_11174/m.20771 type:complete len:593 (-) Transcript_11174:3058-4836(-)|eukprot:CAMPEP_0203757646 /NCGR_PEP_ID=MMETSP0098-20131031/10614_1 /ASSEMBLY_ACC=CAM_ASM_000208 /TAXON_ID=96639 /ORGANISM=" , Strain NY0313808BC1" /LENGTH=592 /DNA_ID=CAMNT_0050649873 /DNA_START=274 /DNA_END=2052 /DNA_ORIENTATION=-